MSFLKITDPAKRDLIVAEFLKTKKNIQQNFLNEKLGDIGLQQELTKFYKPIVDSQSAISKEQNALLSTIKENSAATSNALQALPASISSSIKTIQASQQPAIEASKGDSDKAANILKLGGIAAAYLQQYVSNKKSTDTTFGIRSEDRIFYIGDKPITIQGDNITVAGKTYDGTLGLWELLTMAKPTKSIYEDDDLKDYGEILRATNAMRHENNPNKPKSSRSEKWLKIIKPIWKASKGKIGEGVVVLPQAPNALVEMLALRLASFQAGNTGVRNEIVGICDELLRQGVIDATSYKNLMLQL